MQMCQAYLESPGEKGQHIPNEPLDEHELGAVQLLTADTVPFETENCHWSEEAYEGHCGTQWETVLHPLAYDDLQPWD